MTFKALSKSKGGQHEPPHGVLRRVFRMLERLEERQEAGILTYENVDLFRGSFMLRDGRLCLIVGSEQHQLANLLSDECPEAGPVIRQAFNAARDGKTRLGDALMALGGPVIDQIRGCLRKSSAQALIQVALNHIDDEYDAYREIEPMNWRDSWVPARPDYAQALTFSPRELYFEAAALLDQAPEDRARRAFVEFASLTDFAILLTEESPDDRAGLPLSLHHGDLQTLSELRKLSHSLHKISHVPSLIAAGERPQCMMVGHRFNDHILIFGRHRMALLASGDVGVKARITNWALKHSAEAES